MATSGKALNDRDRERIRKLAEQGRSVRTVASIMSCSKTTVQKIVAESR